MQADDEIHLIRLPGYDYWNKLTNKLLQTEFEEIMGKYNHKVTESDIGLSINQIIKAISNSHHGSKLR